MLPFVGRSTNPFPLPSSLHPLDLDTILSLLVIERSETELSGLDKVGLPSLRGRPPVLSRRSGPRLGTPLQRLLPFAPTILVLSPFLSQ